MLGPAIIDVVGKVRPGDNWLPTHLFQHLLGSVGLERSDLAEPLLDFLDVVDRVLLESCGLLLVVVVLVALLLEAGSSFLQECQVPEDLLVLLL